MFGLLEFLMKILLDKKTGFVECVLTYATRTTLGA
jgi:hypothetical protein